MYFLKLASIGLSITFLTFTVTASDWPPNKQSDTYILRYDTIHHPVRAKTSMVVTQNKQASEVGRDILARGGNAVDAAVATGFALAVTLPRAGNLGGGGFMLAHIQTNKHLQTNPADKTKHKPNSSVMAIDFRGEAPALANQKFYTRRGKTDRIKTKTGHTASTVPGTVAGLYEAHRRWGILPWADVLAPAITLADEGITVSHDLAWALNAKSIILSKNPEACAIYFSNCSSFAEEGTLLKQPALANTLRLIANGGADTFYKGAIAKKIVEDMKNNGGLIRLSDLANYKARVIDAISTDYRSYQIVSMPPPAGGLPLLQTLNIMEHFPFRKYGPGSAMATHVMAEAMKRSYSYRAKYLGDPRFQSVPVQKILDKRLAASLAAEIDLTKATPVVEITPRLDIGFPDSPNTTHFSVIDKFGNAVATTYTLSASFGSGVVIENTGILMNNQINNYSYNPDMNSDEYEKIPNSLQPGKRPKSTQSPTLVFKNNDVFLVTGTPGGKRIITTVVQLISNLVDHNLNIAEATILPRIHQDIRRDELEHEPGFNPDTLNILNDMGHKLELGASMGSTQSIHIIDKEITGFADPRRPNAKALPL